jgi:Fe-S oxidoreductase
MTVTYQPGDPAYFDEADARREMARSFDVCNGCQRCSNLCGVFPSLFERLAQIPEGRADHMTPADQDAIAEQCFHCSLCSIGCPYLSGVSPTGVDPDTLVDFPRLMVRAAAIRHRGGHLAPTERFTSSVINRTALLGGLGVRASGVVNRIIGSQPESMTRRTVAKVTGISAVRLIPPYARQRFSTWFAKRGSPAERRTNRTRRQVTVFPTCTVEYLQPEIGHDLVKVYERNGIDCSLSAAGCCGAPWLHSGDLDRFGAIAAKNVKILAAEIRAGTEIVVPQPTCGMILKQAYLDYVGGEDADLVAAHSFDATEYLWRIAQAESTENTEIDGGSKGGLDLRFEGKIPAQVTYHSACHLRAQGLARTSADLLALTGAKVSVVEQCSGTDGLWGLRRGNEGTAVAMAQALGAALEAAGGEILSGDCHLANTAITEVTSQVPQHPLQVLARAYGIHPEP